MINIYLAFFMPVGHQRGTNLEAGGEAETVVPTGEIRTAGTMTELDEIATVHPAEKARLINA